MWNYINLKYGLGAKYQTNLNPALFKAKMIGRLIDQMMKNRK